MEKIKEIAILMATYNGEKYVEQQIESIIHQTVSNWTLYIHDDGSTDKTIPIIVKYADIYANIKILDYTDNHGAKENFLGMTRKVKADYYLFCDQDDVWHNDKIEKEMREMHEMEKQYGNIPLLVFSDLEVVDSNLNTRSKSMWQCGGVRPELLSSFNAGAVFEYVTGCTMLFNEKACSAIQYPAEAALMHDSWVTCCILKSGGKVREIDEPLVFYRQHYTNTLGATQWYNQGIAYKIVHIFDILKKNYRHWKMLKALEYGSFFKYIIYKYIHRYVTHGKK